MRLHLPLLLLGFPALADLPVVEDVVATRARDGWTFAVTLRHADEGWDHYADRWAVFAPDGRELGTRTLLHPHETEQPFTRSQSGIAIPDGTREAIVRGHDIMHGWGEGFAVALPRGDTDR